MKGYAKGFLKKYSLLSLRYTISATLLIILLILNIFIFMHEKAARTDAVETEMATLSREHSLLLAGIIAYSYRYKLETLVQSSVAALSSHQNIYSVLLVSAKGTIVASSKKNWIGENFKNRLNFIKPSITSHLLDNNDYFTTKNIQGNAADNSRYLVAITPLDLRNELDSHSNFQLIIIYEIDNYLNAHLYLVKKKAIVYSLLFFITSLLLAYLLLKLVTQRTQGIVDTIFKYRSGELDARAEKTWNDEIGFISAEFNSLLNSVEESTRSLLLAKITAETASRAKSDFLANISHDIRTPLHVVLGMQELLLEGVLTDKQRKQLSIVQSASRNLLDILNNVLDIAKIESGEVTLEQINFNLHEIIQGIVQLLTIRVNAKGLTINFVSTLNSNTQFIGDPTRIQQILMNLLSNAIKFTDRGSIEVRLSKNDTARLGNMLIQVIDTGHGINKKNFTKIFQPFAQENASINRSHGGTGLGLSISRSLVSLMNGDLWVESIENTGSTFSFTLNLKENEANTLNLNAPTMNTKKITARDKNRIRRLLLVDDSLDNRTLVKFYLENENFEIIEAQNGAEALELFKKQNFDVIIMDLQMPVMDGLSATKLIRQYEISHSMKALPILGLSAHALKEFQDKAYSSGFSIFLTKPIKKQHLIEKLDHFTSQDL